MSERKGRTDRRMPRHRQFHAWRKDPYTTVCGGMFRRKDECGFCECHFQSDALHQFRLEASGLRENGQLVTGQRLIREYVEMEISIAFYICHAHRVARAPLALAR